MTKTPETGGEVEETLLGSRLRPASLIASGLITLLLVAAVLLLAQGPSMAFLEARVETRPVSSVVFYMGFMAAWSLTTLSCIPFMLLGGSLFGPWLGALWALGGMLVGTWLNFVIGRRWQASMASFSARYARVGRIHALVLRRPLVAVLIVRAVVGFPISFLRYGLAASGMTARDYMVGSFLAILPGVVLYSGLGSLIFELIHTRRVDGPTMVAVGIAAALMVLLALLIRRVRRGEDAQPA